MTSKEAKNLKVGDKVEFSDGVQGTVISISDFTVGIDWNDGQCGFIALDDMGQVERVAKKAVA